MPELPEVEVTRRRIEPRLVGRTIREVVTTAPSYFFLTPPRELKRRLVGRRVMGLSRHGKYLLLDLDDGSRVDRHAPFDLRSCWSRTCEKTGCLRR